MKNTIPFNINSYVRVRLTERGEEIYKEFFPARRSRPLRQRGDDGWNRFQLWQLMEIFGPHMSIGKSTAELPFATDILIESEAAQEAADAELEACCEWLRSRGSSYATALHSVRYPRPLSPTLGALEALDRIECDLVSGFPGPDPDIEKIRQFIKSTEP